MPKGFRLEMRPGACNVFIVNSSVAVSVQCQLARRHTWNRLPALLLLQQSGEMIGEGGVRAARARHYALSTMRARKPKTTVRYERSFSWGADQ